VAIVHPYVSGGASNHRPAAEEWGLGGDRARNGRQTMGFDAESLG
jgi:hypothetical protein